MSQKQLSLKHFQCYVKANTSATNTLEVKNRTQDFEFSPSSIALFPCTFTSGSSEFLCKCGVKGKFFAFENCKEVGVTSYFLKNQSGIYFGNAENVYFTLTFDFLEKLTTTPHP